MPIRPNREYRDIPVALPIQPENSEEKSYIVEGYASTFEPYVLMTIDGVDYNERIEPTAFERADLSDVVFLKDHAGTVMARTSNGTIQLMPDEHGLKQRTDLSKTKASREMYEEINAGMYNKMSFAFTVEEEHYEKETRTRVIDRFAKIYDISAVSHPANPGTEIGISMRDYFNGVIEAEKAERLEAQRKEELRKKLQIRLKMEG